MLEIAEENVFVKKVKFQCSGSGQKYLYIPGVFDENGLDVEVGDEIELYMDKKNKVIFFIYGKGNGGEDVAGDRSSNIKMGDALNECWIKRGKAHIRKANGKSH